MRERFRQFPLAMGDIVNSLGRGQTLPSRAQLQDRLVGSARCSIHDESCRRSEQRALVLSRLLP